MAVRFVSLCVSAGRVLIHDAAVVPRRPFAGAAALMQQNQGGAAEFWLQQLAGYSARHLPRLREDPRSTSATSATTTMHIASRTLPLATAGHWV